MRWCPLILATAVTAVGPLGPAGMASASAAEPAAPKQSRSSKSSASDSKASKSSKASASSTSKKKRRAKRIAKGKRKRDKRTREEVQRAPNRRTASNMPRGWSWPPSRAMKKAGARCTTALDDAGIGWRPAPVDGKMVTPIVLDSLLIGGVEYHPTFRKPPFPMDCHLALALATHSPALHALGVRKVNFGSIFRFTKVRAHGKTKNVLSRHALGLAMDVVSFEGQDGAVVNVEKDYPLGAELLLAVEDTLNASGGFRTVLTPRNDPTSHHDHFHIEADVSYYDDERNLAGLRASGAARAIVKAGEKAGEPASGEEVAESESDDRPVTSTRSDRKARSSVQGSRAR
jgi:hypothetical protein